MYKKLIISTIICIVFLTGQVIAQEKGIHFEAILNWQQIKEKAKIENKYIMVDCYATWCGPCKEMDQETYPDSTLGVFVNDHFIAVKVQMDSTKSDPERIIAWRNDAKELMTSNNVNSLPTFLFFSPDGRLVHKTVAFHSAKDFLNIAVDAINPAKQEYTLFAIYKAGSYPKENTYSLIKLLEHNKNHEAAAEVASDYIHNYLLKLPDDQRYTKKNLKLMNAYLVSSEDPVFRLFYNNARKIDSAAIDPGFANEVTDQVIANEEIYPKLWSDKSKKTPVAEKPDWKSIVNSVAKKYNEETAKRAILWPKLEWYQKTKEWDALAKANIDVINTYHLVEEKAIVVNNICYNLFFFHITDKKYLGEAVRWMKVICTNRPEDKDSWDTYAGLLYKTGYLNDALAAEQKAIDLSIAAKDQANVTQLQKTKSHMVNGDKFWLDKEYQQ